jgi:hypothetical protein
MSPISIRGPINRGRCLIGHWHFFFQEDWGKNNFGPFNPNVIGALELKRGKGWEKTKTLLDFVA